MWLWKFKTAPKSFFPEESLFPSWGPDCWRVRGTWPGGGDYVWWLAGRRVTLQTRYFLFICPQCVISTFRPVTEPCTRVRTARLEREPCVPTTGSTGTAARPTLGTRAAGRPPSTPAGPRPQSDAVLEEMGRAGSAWRLVSATLAVCALLRVTLSPSAGPGPQNTPRKAQVQRAGARPPSPKRVCPSGVGQG